MGITVALLAPCGALADSGPPPPGFSMPARAARVPFYTVGSGLIPNVVPASSYSLPALPNRRNRILIARTRTQANRWKGQLQPEARAAIHDNYFPEEALLGVFFRRDPAQAVKVTGLWLAGETLTLALGLVPWPVYVCAPPPGVAGCGGPAPNIPPPAGTNPYVLVAVRQVALAKVSQVVVSEEVDDAPQVIQLVPSFVTCSYDPADPQACAAITP
jgi:hypothetical protein